MLDPTKKPHPKDVDLGARIRQRRTILGISQGSLAEVCGISFQQIQKYETGKNRVAYSRLVQIAEVLKCSVSSLAGDGVSSAEPEVMDATVLRFARRLNELPADIRTPVIHALSKTADAIEAARA